MKSNKLIFSSWFDRQELIINYLDVGARGDVSEPWSLFSPESIKVIGFEPDPEECARLSAAYPKRKYYPNALWGGKGLRPFYLCEWESTSSMYQPSVIYNKQYRRVHWSGRIPAKTLQVECVRLDSILELNDKPDFIKIDTQGSELQILQGAEQLLRQASPIVLAETWCTEVYSGMPLTHDVMAFMYQLGYQVFDLNVAAAWQHSNKMLTEVNCKSKTIGFDLLFVKRLECLGIENEDDLLKFVGLCELFGFRDYALAVLERTSIKSQRINDALQILIQNNSREKLLNNRWLRLFRRLLGRNVKIWPQLH